MIKKSRLKKIKVFSLILASASPRRKQLLRQAGVVFRVMPSRYREGAPQGEPGVFAQLSALAKASEVAARVKTPAWVLGADTVVVLGKKIFGKPSGREQAGRMLRQLSGREHVVVTGVAWVNTRTHKTRVSAVRTKVRMRVLEPRELEAYLDSGEWRGKAGAYGIQGRAGAFVDNVNGCYFNVVGLPLSCVCAQWRKFSAGQA
jgi:septum formation protein